MFQRLRQRRAASVLVISLLVGCSQATDSTNDGKPKAASAPNEGKHETTSIKPAPSKSAPAVNSEVRPDGKTGDEKQTEPNADPTKSAEVGARGRLLPRPPLRRARGATPEAPGELTMPQVSLTDDHRSTCKVVVGDMLPNLAIASLAGKPATLREGLGRSYTVVVFWQANDVDAIEELADLDALVAQPFGGAGVNVVTVNLGASSEAVRVLATKGHWDFPVFLDSKGEATAAIAPDPRGLMPRTYLVDDSGKVLWFDIEYSRTTRRDLYQALMFLTHGKR